MCQKLSNVFSQLTLVRLSELVKNGINGTIFNTFDELCLQIMVLDIINYRTCWKMIQNYTNYLYKLSIKRNGIFIGTRNYLKSLIFYKINIYK